MNRYLERGPQRHGLLFALLALVAGCNPQGAAPVAAPVEVSTLTVVARDTALPLQYAGQAESSRLVQIQARVDGYLQKKYYTEGVLITKGQPMFQIDPAPMQVNLNSANATVSERENNSKNAQLRRERVQMLLKENAVSGKDAEDAVAAEKAATASLQAARAEQARARMNLAFADIRAPLTGLAGRASVAEGSYISPGSNGLLTQVAQVDPIWVNFSISESEWLRFGEEATRGVLRLPKEFNFDVEMLLADGSTFPARGKIAFAAPSVDALSGTYAIRASFPNPKMTVRPGQFVRVHLLGAERPHAILVPQRAVMQGQTGKFVYVVGKDDKAEMRPVELGDWHGDQWFVNAGLRSGERIVVDGIVKVQPGVALKVIAAKPALAASKP